MRFTARDFREVYRGREIFKLQNRLAQPGPDALYYP